MLLSSSAAQFVIAAIAAGIAVSGPPVQDANVILPLSTRIQEPVDCPAYPIAPGTPVATPEETQAAVMAFVDAGRNENVEKMDATMAPDATMWFAGSGCVDRSQWGPAHYANPHPKADFVRVEMSNLVVQGDRASFEMISDKVWPGGGYLKFHSIHVQVSQGKIVSLRQYSIDARAAPGPI